VIIFNLIIILTVIAYPLYLIIKWGIVFFFYGKDYEPPPPNLSGKLHEPPSQIKPYLVDSLVNKNLTPSHRSISSTLLWFVKQKYLNISYKDTFNKLGTRKRQFFLTLENDKLRDIPKLNSAEQRLLGFIFQGNDNNIATFDEIKSYGLRKATITHQFWGYWKNSILLEMIEKNLLDPDSYVIKGAVGKELLIIITIFIGTILKTDHPLLI
jgi:hypothetical protein